MRRVVIVGALLCLGAVLGATVLRNPVATAQNAIQNVVVKNTATNPIPVREQNVSGQGNIRVHEQGTANVDVTNVDANGNVKVHEQGTVTTQDAAPAHPFYFSTKNSSDGCGQNLPAGTKWFLTAVGGANTFPAVSSLGTAKIVGEPVRPVLTGSGANVLGPLVNVLPGDTTELTFPQPYVLTSPAAGYCLRIDVNAATPTVVGYRE